MMSYLVVVEELQHHLTDVIEPVNIETHQRQQQSVEQEPGGENADDLPAENHGTVNDPIGAR